MDGQQRTRSPARNLRTNGRPQIPRSRFGLRSVQQHTYATSCKKLVSEEEKTRTIANALAGQNPADQWPTADPSYASGYDLANLQTLHARCGEARREWDVGVLQTHAQRLKLVTGSGRPIRLRCAVVSVVRVLAASCSHQDSTRQARRFALGGVTWKCWPVLYSRWCLSSLPVWLCDTRSGWAPTARRNARKTPSTSSRCGSARCMRP